jgi:DNA polymerase-3 subunit epsilon
MNTKKPSFSGFASWFKNRDRQLPAGWPDAISETEFVILDTETTGLNPKEDRILSIGTIRLKAGRIRTKDSVEVFLLQEHFDRTTVPIHGILREGRHPRQSEAEAMNWLQTYTANAVLIGHHIGFDLRMIREAFERHGIPPLTNPALDTGLLYRKTLIKSPLVRKKDFYSLDDLAQKYDLSREDRHTALGDAYLTAMVFQHILEQLGRKGPLSVSKLLKLSRYP